jgi:hypothetical protein
VGRKGKVIMGTSEETSNGKEKQAKARSSMRVHLEVQSLRYSCPVALGGISWARRRPLRIADVWPGGHPHAHASISIEPAGPAFDAQHAPGKWVSACTVERRGYCVDIAGCRDLHSRIAQISTSENHPKRQWSLVRYLCATSAPDNI